MDSKRVVGRWLICALAALALASCPTRPAAAVGETSTRFGVYIPPSAYTGRPATLVVTAIQDGTQVDILDDNADGDTDDTVAGVALNTGQSYILYIREGTVNDDGTGASAKMDGDFFLIQANKPVLAVNLTANTNWQHAFVPADNRTMTGTSFYLYRHAGYSGSNPTPANANNAIIDIFAYNDDTHIKIIDITETPKVTSGRTTVVSDTRGIVVLDTTLDAGQDLIEVKGIRQPLEPGNTYHIISNKGVSIQFGAIGRETSYARDGGGYVPGKTGYSADRTFYFLIPYYAPSERELRLVSYSRPANVTVRGWHRKTGAWVTIATPTIPAYGHVDLVGSALGLQASDQGYYYFEVTSDNTISVFEANWLETGSYGTSDMACFISSESGTGAGVYFQAYMGPPADHSRPDGTKSKTSNLVVSTYAGAQVQIYDADSYGEYIELYNNSNQTVDLSGWTVKNADGWMVTAPAGQSVGPKQTFMLKYHAKATETAGGYVYGGAFPKFKLANGRDNIVLSDPTGAYSDTLSYTDTGWGSHGVYRALERKSPDLPFTAANSQDSSVAHSKTTANLGDYYGTPGIQQGSPGTGNGNVVISEVMSGRIYRNVTIPPDFYYDTALTVSEWEGINNGEPPGTANENPEKPYLLVEASAPVSVMVANWNDNWITWATGTLQPDPTLNVTADYYQREAGQPVTFTAYVFNRFVPLANPVTTLVAPVQINYTPGSYSTPEQLRGVTPTEVRQADGSWLITWTHGKPLPADDYYRFQIQGRVDPALAANALLQMMARVAGAAPDRPTLVFSSQASAGINVGPAQRTATNDVVINEVMVNPICGEQQIELHNRSTSAVDISGWELADGRGFVFRFPTPMFIANDAYLVLHLSDGQNSAAHLYTGLAYAGALDPAEGQVSLFTDSDHTALTLVDFVQYATGRLVNPNGETIAVRAGLWPKGGFVPAAAKGQSLGRDRNATDSNVPADWENTGGVHASRPTLGAINVSPLDSDVTPPDPVGSFAASALVGQEGAVRLSWQNPPNGDLAGVKVLRKATGYPQTLNDGAEVHNGLGGSVIDTGLPSGQPVFYTAFPYDDSGNVACQIAANQVRAIPPQRIHLAYEDLKGVGWADWDVNDLVVVQDSGVDLTQAGISGIQMRFGAEARGSAYNHRLRLSMDIFGSANATVLRYNAQGNLLATETTNFTDQIDLVIFDQSTVALPGNAPNGTANTMPGTGRQLGYSTHVSITLANPARNPPETAQMPPYDPWLEVLDTGARIHLMQGGGVGNTQTVWDARSQLVGRDLPLALSLNQAWAWPLENWPIWDAYPDYTAFITSGAQINSDWFNRPDPTLIWTPTTRVRAAAPASSSAAAAVDVATAAGWPQTVQGIVFASPVIADVNGDGANELIAATQDGVVYAWNPDGSILNGWPRSLPATTRSSPAVGDIDGDGTNEVVIGCDCQALFAWHADGQPVAGFPIMVNGNIKSSPALADLDGQPGAEIVFSTGDLNVYAVRGNGIVLPGWPIKMNGVTESYGNLIFVSTPAVGDLDGDNQPEIVAGSTDGRIYVWRKDGSPFSPLWPHLTGDWVYPSPVIVDLDRNGYRDIVAASGDGRLYAWRGDGFALPGFPVRLRGGMVASPAVVDLDRDGNLEIILATIAGNVYAYRQDGTLMDGWPRYANAAIYSSPVAGDLDGDGDLEVVVGSHDGAVYAWHHTGIPVIDWPKRTQDWVVASPALGDLDSDGKVEVAAGGYDQQLYVWRTEGAYDPANMPWTAFRGGPARTGFVATDAPIKPLPQTHQYWLPLVSHQ